MRSQVIYPFRSIEWVIGRKCIEFPNINTEKTYGINVTPSFHEVSTTDAAKSPLDKRFEGSKISLQDFSIQDKGLEINIRLQVNKLEKFFSGDDAVAAQKDVLSAVILWDSKDSLQRGVGIPCEICSTSDKTIVLKQSFNAGQLRNSINIRVAIFLKTPYPGNRLREFAKTPGTYLGTLYGPWTIELEGNASQFPIVVDEQLDAKLPPWSIRLEYDDPLSDAFSLDHFAIIINKNNDESEFILPPPDQPRLIQPALKEIVSAALAILIEELRSNNHLWSEIMEGKSEPGSIGAAAAYIHDALKADSPEQYKLVSQIRANLCR